MDECDLSCLSAGGGTADDTCVVTGGECARNKPKSVFDNLRETLVPLGSSNIVSLNIGTAFYEDEFVKKCIDDLQMKALTVHTGLDEFTTYEKLAFDLLCDAAEARGMRPIPQTEDQQDDEG